MHTVPIGAYANNGHDDAGGWAFTGEYTPARYLEEAQRWLNLGARIAGGCCGTTPEHIRQLVEATGRETTQRLLGANKMSAAAI